MFFDIHIGHGGTGCNLYLFRTDIVSSIRGMSEDYITNWREL